MSSLEQQAEIHIIRVKTEEMQVDCLYSSIVTFALQRTVAALLRGAAAAF